MEYASRHPDRVSHLILLNAAPMSHADLLRWWQGMQRKSADDLEAQTFAVRYGYGFAIVMVEEEPRKDIE